MYTQFFGNYLLSRKYVTKEQLFSAMQKQSGQHMRLGTLAIAAGLMTASEVDSIVIQQTHEDKKFGELAIELGYLTENQELSLLKNQNPDFLLLGQILVDDGVITNSDLEMIIADYRSQNEMTEIEMLDDQENIQRLFDNFFITAEAPVTRLGKMFWELLFNNFIRFVGDDFTPLSCEECKEFPVECCARQEVIGEYSVVSYLNMNEETAIEFASRYVGDHFDTYDEYVQASLEDFLNLHNGLFIVNCSNDHSMELSITAPTHIDDSIITFEENTYYIPVLYSFGTVHFIIQIRSNANI